MPELPEVEVVRAGMIPAVTGSRVISVEVFDERSLKRHQQSLGSFESLLSRACFDSPVRRGKFLWMPLKSESRRDQDSRPLALLAHLGMSGQLLVRDIHHEDDKHVRVRLRLDHPREGSDNLRLDFADQRLFGSLAIDHLVATDDGMPGGLGTMNALVPSQAAHISRDILDPAFDEVRFRERLRNRRVEIKKALLNQQLVSGIGNIYADESLWAARIHPETPSGDLSARKINQLMFEVRNVLHRALAEGGTSFDQQYVNVNGQAGYFEHSLNVYGRQHSPCPRCGSAIIRSPFMNRNSHYCSRCQRMPRRT